MNIRLRHRAPVFAIMGSDCAKANDTLRLNWRGSLSAPARPRVISDVDPEYSRMGEG
jgi:hypothetical protein